MTYLEIFLWDVVLDPVAFAQAKTAFCGNLISFSIWSHLSSILTEANEVNKRRGSLKWKNREWEKLKTLVGNRLKTAQSSGLLFLHLTSDLSSLQAAHQEKDREKEKLK